VRWIPATAVKRDERLAASEINKHKAYGWQLTNRNRVGDDGVVGVALLVVWHALRGQQDLLILDRHGRSSAHPEQVVCDGL